MKRSEQHARAAQVTLSLGDDSGVTLVVTLLILALMAGLMAGFFAAVNTDMRSHSLDQDQTRAYAAAHAGLEKLTSDLAAVFTGNVAPTTAQINALLLNPPVIPFFEFRAPGGAAGSGYTVTWKPDGNGNPAPDDPSGSTITAGDYIGLKGMVTRYPVTVTARSTTAGAEVRLRRDLQTVAVPVFQFGLYSQSDLSFFAGPNFNFGGRIHTNGTLFLAEGSGSTLTLSDKVTAAVEVNPWQLSNGYLTDTNYTGAISIATAPGGPFRNLARNEGSLQDVVGSPANDPLWMDLSGGTYNSFIRSSRTGAKTLNLPLVTQGATPIDLIRRPPANEDTANALVFQQRHFAQASVRILLSDRAADITGLPTMTAPAPISLDWLAGVPAGYGPIDATHPPMARSPGPLLLPVGTAWTTLSGNPTSGGTVYPLTNFVPTSLKMPSLTVNGVTGVICTEQTPTWLKGCTHASAPGGSAVSATVTYGTYTWTASTTTSANSAANADIPVGSTAGFTPTSTFWVNDTTAAAPAVSATALVTCTGYKDISVGPHQLTGCSYSGNASPVAGQKISTNAAQPLDTALTGGFLKIEKQNLAGVWSDVTLEILNLGFADTNSQGTICADPTPNAVIRIQRLRDNGGNCNYASSLNPYDYWPNALYDPREGNVRDVATNGAGSGMLLGGVMNYVALDTANLAKWLAGTTGTTGTQAWNNNGYIVYFSDRRGNHWAGAAVPNAETGEYGAEDMINPLDSTGAPNSAIDIGEDINGSGVLDIYGQSPATCCGVVPVGTLAPFDAATSPWVVFAGANNPGAARVNRQVLFRRALKLINGGINGGVNNLPPTGLTVTTDNPVYVQGNYNAQTNMVQADASVPAAVLSDSLTLLSNQWNDARSFNNPNDPAQRLVTGTASFRMAVAAGKTLSFPRPTWGAANDFGTDGGVHNFLRYVEGWNGQTLNYIGSIVSLYTSRQAIGTYKCCTNVYSPPTRAYAFDTNFLIPSRLPPGTPMFRDINTLTFRQILRPTQ